MKKEQKLVRVYMQPEEAAVVEQIATALQQTESWVTTTLCAAALRAIRDNGCRFPMPLQFQIEEEDSPPVRALPPKRKAA